MKTVTPEIAISAGIALALLLTPFRAEAQSPFGGQHPPGMRWKIIDTPHFRIIFPEEISADARRVANTLEAVYGPVGRTLGVRMKRQPVILANQSSISNGMLTVAPRRSEWLSPPVQVTTGDSETLEWYELLASHEMRHAAQFDRFSSSSFAGTLGYFAMGETGQWLAMFVNVPLWFLEGDAVLTETVLTTGGRGRRPEFGMPIRALLLSGKEYDYYPAYLGSYRNWYPDYYQLGYWLVTYVRRECRPQSWERILETCSNNPFSLFLPVTFDWAVKQETGEGIADLHETVMTDLRMRWAGQIEGLEFTAAKRLHAAERDVKTDYLFPQEAGNGGVIALKRGMGTAARLVWLGPGGDELRSIRINTGSAFSARGGKIAWDRITHDPRWGARTYSDIVVFDTRTGRRSRVTSGQRLHCPALSPGGEMIAAVEFTDERRCSIVVLSSATGERLQTFHQSDGEIAMTPSWADDSKRVVFTRQGEGGREICLLDTGSGETTALTARSPEQVARPVLSGGVVYYGSPRSGIDNIYALDLASGRRYRVTSSRFGAFNPSASKGRLLYNDYTADGHDAVEASLDRASWKPVEEVEDGSLRYYDPVISQEQGGPLLGAGAVRDSAYEIGEYTFLSNFKWCHSWDFWPVHPYYLISLYSSDLLSTADLSVGGEYDYNEKTWTAVMNARYAGFYPVIEVGASHGARASTYMVDDTEINEHWTETAGGVTIGVPLNLSGGIYAASLSLSAGVEYRHVRDREVRKIDEQGNGTMLPLTYAASFNRTRHGAMRDVWPALGQAIGVSYTHTPTGIDALDGSLLSAYTTLHFPGAVRHHGVRVSGQYEGQTGREYRFSSSLFFPRGYDYTSHDDFYSGSIGYALPLLYPDIALGKYLYCKRIHGVAFFDYGFGEDEGGFRRLYRSIGGEIYLRTTFFSNIMLQLDLGIRYSYLIDDKRGRVEFAIGMPAAIP